MTGDPLTGDLGCSRRGGPGARVHSSLFPPAANFEIVRNREGAARQTSGPWGLRVLGWAAKWHDVGRGWGEDGALGLVLPQAKGKERPDEY